MPVSLEPPHPVPLRPSGLSIDATELLETVAWLCEVVKQQVGSEGGLESRIKAVEDHAKTKEDFAQQKEDIIMSRLALLEQHVRLNAGASPPPMGRTATMGRTASASVGTTSTSMGRLASAGQPAPGATIPEQAVDASVRSSVAGEATGPRSPVTLVSGAIPTAAGDATTTSAGGDDTALPQAQSRSPSAPPPIASRTPSGEVSRSRRSSKELPPEGDEALQALRLETGQLQLQLKKFMADSDHRVRLQEQRDNAQDKLLKMELAGLNLKLESCLTDKAVEEKWSVMESKLEDLKKEYHLEMDSTAKALKDNLQQEMTTLRETNQAVADSLEKQAQLINERLDAATKAEGEKMEGTIARLRKQVSVLCSMCGFPDIEELDEEELAAALSSGGADVVEDTEEAGDPAAAAGGGAVASAPGLAAKRKKRKDTGGMSAITTRIADLETQLASLTILVGNGSPILAPEVVAFPAQGDQQPQHQQLVQPGGVVAGSGTGMGVVQSRELPMQVGSGDAAIQQSPPAGAAGSAAAPVVQSRDLNFASPQASNSRDLPAASVPSTADNVSGGQSTAKRGSFKGLAAPVAAANEARPRSADRSSSAGSQKTAATSAAGQQPAGVSKLPLAQIGSSSAMEQRLVELEKRVLDVEKQQNQVKHRKSFLQMPGTAGSAVTATGSAQEADAGTAGASAGPGSARRSGSKQSVGRSPRSARSVSGDAEAGTSSLTLGQADGAPRSASKLGSARDHRQMIDSIADQLRKLERVTEDRVQDVERVFKAWSDATTETEAFLKRMTTQHDKRLKVLEAGAGIPIAPESDIEPSLRLDPANGSMLESAFNRTSTAGDAFSMGPEASEMSADADATDGNDARGRRQPRKSRSGSPAHQLDRGEGGAGTGEPQSPTASRYQAMAQVTLLQREQEVTKKKVEALAAELKKVRDSVQQSRSSQQVMTPFSRAATPLRPPGDNVQRAESAASAAEATAEAAAQLKQELIQLLQAVENPGTDLAERADALLQLQTPGDRADTDTLLSGGDVGTGSVFLMKQAEIEQRLNSLEDNLEQASLKRSDPGPEDVFQMMRALVSHVRQCLRRCELLFQLPEIRSFVKRFHKSLAVNAVLQEKWLGPPQGSLDESSLHTRSVPDLSSPMRKREAGKKRGEPSKAEIQKGPKKPFRTVVDWCRPHTPLTVQPVWKGHG
eukprot:CAMPEP_0178434330 /NCGR_PEP_ID=MMETSP0689_2-20121128/33369_1 /TAXON_ID=160604 /ORGANISM="Amphidinium massartii, Strain CS-259" /LENGTH=1185 /DNA_ID=CAMNT_0020056393 /DNA_START=32 /DNA_END=3586 /DNA_ORIENTATION=-